MEKDKHNKNDNKNANKNSNKNANKKKRKKNKSKNKSKSNDDYITLKKIKPFDPFKNQCSIIHTLKDMKKIK